jgi:ABC-type transport system involved in Fe-S cluster assembly fused permease/ATPase subunit
LLDILGGSFIRKDKELYDQSLKKYNKLYLIAIILLTAVYSSYFLIYRFDFLWLFITFTSVIIYQYLYITALMYSIQEKRKYAGSVEYLKVEEEIEERDD